MTRMSGTTPKFSHVKNAPVRPSAWGISSRMSRAPWRSQAARTACQYAGDGMYGALRTDSAMTAATSPSFSRT